jgi:hypothetical protein
MNDEHFKRHKDEIEVAYDEYIKEMQKLVKEKDQLAADLALKKISGGNNSFDNNARKI